jgi:putative protein kinase ArgK-like GTPase of G3E family
MKNVAVKSTIFTGLPGCRKSTLIERILLRLEVYESDHFVIATIHRMDASKY